MTEETSSVVVFICGSALRGQPDHRTIADTQFLKTVQTQPYYRLHSVEDKHPGIYEVAEGGISIPGELYGMTQTQYEHLLSCEPPHLYPSPVVMEDGSSAIAMLYPREVIEERQYPDISHYGGWAAYKAAQTE